MTDNEIKEKLKANLIGKTVKIDGRKFEVVDDNKDRIQVIEFGKTSAKWIDKKEVVGQRNDFRI